MAKISIEKIVSHGCPLGNKNCVNCPLFGDIVDGILICYHEESDIEED